MEHKHRFKVRYETEIITENKRIKPNGFSSIVFRNLGDTDAVVLENIPLKAHVANDTYFDEFMFINRPGEIIAQDLGVKFSAPNAGPSVLVIKTFYEI